jgi:hypothetical protein
MRAAYLKPQPEQRHAVEGRLAWSCAVPLGNNGVSKQIMVRFLPEAVIYF